MRRASGMGAEEKVGQAHLVLEAEEEALGASSAIDHAREFLARLADRRGVDDGRPTE